MEEVLFIKKNAEHWKKIEFLVSNIHTVDPDLISDLYIQLTDDLSYARTFFPKSKTCLYLNHLSSQIHQSLYQNKKEKTSQFVHFWKKTLPSAMRSSQREMLLSISIFILSVFVGVVSSANDFDFIKLILGDRYVHMTLENIDKEDPLAVYKMMNELDMFAGITINNIRVAIFAFVMGTLFSFGTGWILFKNGVMLGAFHYLFFKYGLLSKALLTIWIHGTLEIAGVLLAGGAGIVLGNSILFPGTYSRLLSFQMGALRGIRILMGTVPLFIAAGFLEGFVTRQTEMPMLLNLLIIGFSLCMVVGYYYIYPFTQNGGELNEPD